MVVRGPGSIISITPSSLSPLSLSISLALHFPQPIPTLPCPLPPDKGDQGGW